MFDKDWLKKLESFGIPTNMISRAIVGLNEYWQPITQLLDQHSMPKMGWSDAQIEFFLKVISNLDSDKDPSGIRIGEREARISTPFLNRFSGGFNHGIGRSGDILAAQPKAAGGSLIQSICNKVVLSLLRSIGLPNIRNAICVPFGTGMSIGMAIRGISNYYKQDLRQKPLILMPRIDHKSPIKGIEYIGCNTHLVPSEFGKNIFAPEGVYVSIEAIKREYEVFKDQISGIVSTTTFFAPRVPDDIKNIAKFAKEHNLIHVINNAYGVQSPEIMKIIRQSIDAGRVDAIIQSTDKNFLTPVGGAVVATPDSTIIDAIGQSYAGRANAAPIVELLISLLSMGQDQYQCLLDQQKAHRIKLENLLQQFAKDCGEHLYDSNNPVSCAMTLQNLSLAQLQKLGGYLYNLRVTGPRVIIPELSTFGCCTETKISPYIVMNAAIGASEDDIIQSITQLKKAISQVKKET